MGSYRLILQRSRELGGAERWLVAGRVLLGAAVIAALYLGVATFRQAALPGCQTGCDEVLASRWSRVGGLPVSWPGALVYAALLVWSGGLARLRATGGTWAVLALSWLVPLAALWFVAVQAGLLGAFCRWCCGCHLAASLGVVALWRARAQAGGSKGGLRAWAREVRWPAAAAAGLVAVLGLSQGLLAPRELAATRELGLPPAVDRAAGAAGAPRVVSIYGEQVRAGELPVLGRLEAPYLALGLVDYTCHHCRRLHLTLERLATDPAGARFAAVELPAARDDQGRDLHRLLLALWRTDSTAHRRVVEGLLHGRIPPQPAAVQRAAIAAIGEAAFAAARQTHGPWIETQLRVAATIQAENVHRTGARGLPQLVLGSRVLFGSLSEERLLAWFSETVNPEAPQLAGRPAPEPPLPGVRLPPSQGSGAPSPHPQLARQEPRPTRSMAGDPVHEVQTARREPNPQAGGPPGLVLHPQALVLTTEELARHTRRAVLLRSVQPDLGFRIVAVELAPTLVRAGVTATVRPLSSGGGYLVDFAFPGDSRLAAGNPAVVVLRTDQPGPASAWSIPVEVRGPRTAATSRTAEPAVTRVESGGAPQAQRPYAVTVNGGAAGVMPAPHGAWETL
jgi:uncharacterized membrane protein/protein-disulfide isomerase